MKKLPRKHILALCLACCFSIGTFAQQVSFSVKNVTVKTAVIKFKKTTGYSFVFGSNKVDTNKKISVNANNQPLRDVVAQILAGQNLDYEINGKFIIVKERQQVEQKAVNPQRINSNSSKIKATGKVTDEKGEPIIGATVMESGTKNGTVTDLNGRYVLEVPVGSNLEISYIGYKNSVVHAGNKMDIALIEEQKSLNEVIVVGYGTQKKSDITGAMVNVSNKSLKEAPVANVAAALQGLAAGVDVQMSGGATHPGAVPQIRIRGERSINAGNDALIVLDGIPFSGNLNDISNDDIESISILKDASATAIYGSRGANGVILITTKKGANGKTKVSYSGYYGVVKAISKYKVMNSEEFIRFKQWAFYNANADKYSGPDDPEIMQINRVFKDQAEMDGYYAGNDTDWQDLIYEDGMTMNHQLSLNGGNEKTSYNASVGYYKGENNYAPHSFERMTAKISVDTQVGKYVKMGLSSLNGYIMNNGENNNPMDQALRASPFATPYNENGILINEIPGSGGQVWNPLLDLQDGAVIDKRRALSTFNVGYLDVTLPYGLSYRFNGGLQLKYETLGQFQASLTTKRRGAQNRSYADHYLGVEYTIENILNWNKIVHKDHNIFLTLMQSVQESKRDGNSIEAYNYFNNNIQFYNPSPDLALGAISGGGGFSKWRIMSFMGRLNYSYREKYLLTATIRSDGSSRLAEGNKWHSFPSVALGWNVMRENFMSKQHIFSALKLRASWGNVGSTAVNPYQTMANLSTNKYMLGSSGVVGVYPNSVPDKSLGWEYTETINLGIDFGFLNNRINGTLEFYQQKTKDLLLGVSLPITSGYSSSYLTNLGNTRNRGVELNISTVNIEGDGQNRLSWNTDFNIFANRNKVTSLGEGVAKDESNNLYVGKDRWVIYSLKADGLWQDTPEDRALAESYGYPTSGNSSVIGTIKIKNNHIDYEADGVTPKAKQVINDDDRVFLGRRSPDFEGGITNRFAYKGFDLSFLFSFRSGGILTSNMHNGWMNTMQGTFNNLKIDYWTPENTNARWPKPSVSGVGDNKKLLARYDASYLKLRNISLGYTIPQSFSRKYGIESMRIYTTAYNLYTWFSSQYKKDGGIDPETSSTVDLNTPPTRSFIVGVNLSF